MKRFWVLTLATVALALTVIGVVIAATNSATGTRVSDPLALHGYPPKSAELLVTLTGGSSIGVSANVNVNFVTNRVDAIVNFPVVISNASVEIRLADHRLYARSANVSSGPWLSTSVTAPSLFGASLELTRPDISLITGFNKKVERSNYATTYVFTRNGVAVSNLLGTSSTTQIGAVRWTISVGSEGEVTKSALRVTSGSSVTALSVTVLSYNKSAGIAVPAAKNVKPLSASVIQKLFRSQNFVSLMFPKNLTSLSQAHLT
jgi:hypothetical protein